MYEYIETYKSDSFLQSATYAELINQILKFSRGHIAEDGDDSINSVSWFIGVNTYLIVSACPILNEDFDRVYKTVWNKYYNYS